MKLTEEVKERIKEFYNKTAEFITNIAVLAKEHGEDSAQVQGYGIAKIKELLRHIEVSETRLDRLPAVLLAVAEKQNLPDKDVAIIKASSEEARESMKGFLESFKTLLENIEYSLEGNVYPLPLINTLKIYVVMLPENLEKRVNSLVSELEVAEAHLTIPEPNNK